MLKLIAPIFILTILILSPLICLISERKANKRLAINIFASFYRMKCNNDFYVFLAPENIDKMLREYMHWTSQKGISKKFKKWLEQWFKQQDTSKQHINCHMAISYLRDKKTYKDFCKTRNWPKKAELEIKAGKFTVKPVNADQYADIGFPSIKTVKEGNKIIKKMDINEVSIIKPPEESNV